ncbi:hypothetical protein DFH06DRAFT_1137432 [Mycena polygramma]|nr:hypothetical protein DFH06DRAFT_1137432 [Mycena polygramma]
MFFNSSYVLQGHRHEDCPTDPCPPSAPRPLKGDFLVCKNCASPHRPSPNIIVGLCCLQGHQQEDCPTKHLARRARPARRVPQAEAQAESAGLEAPAPLETQEEHYEDPPEKPAAPAVPPPAFLICNNCRREGHNAGPSPQRLSHQPPRASCAPDTPRAEDRHGDGAFGAVGAGSNPRKVEFTTGTMRDAGSRVVWMLPAWRRRRSFMRIAPDIERISPREMIFLACESHRNLR